MKRGIVVSCVLILSLVSLLQAQEAPPALDLALEHLSEEVGATVAMANIGAWTWAENVYSDTSMGCPQPGEAYSAEQTRGYAFNIVYQGRLYDYRVAADESAVILCTVSDAGDLPPVQASPEPSPTLAVTPTLQPVGTPANGAVDVAYDDITFSLDETLASDVEVAQVPAVANGADVPFFALHPAYVEFYLTDYAVERQGVAARVAIYPVAEFTSLLPNTVGPEVDYLQRLVESCPDPATDVTMPYLPPLGAEQVFATNVQCLEFENGAGLRYLTVYRQDVSPISNQDLLYVFQGITSDGQRYVSVTVPVTAFILSDTIDPQAVDEDFAENFETYLNDLTRRLNAQIPAEFTPELTLLDDMVESLVVGEVLESTATPVEVAEETRVTWAEAQELILSGEVSAVTQLHSLEVFLQLADGTQVVTTEPVIDAVFDVARECGDPCSGMAVATE